MREPGPESQERLESDAPADSRREEVNPPAAQPGIPASGAYVLMPTSTPGNEHDSSSLVDYLDILLRRRWMILAICVLSVLVAFFYSKRKEPRYRASAAFLVQESARETIAGTPDYRPYQSFRNPADYYRRVALSSEILDPLLRERFHVPGSVEDTTLLAYLVNEQGELKDRTYIGRSILAGCIEVGSQTNFPNLLSLNVSFDNPELAAEIANRLIDLISDFDLGIRAKRARGHSAFIDSQLEIAAAQLEEGEQALEEFQERNRVSNSVKLLTRRGRLEREVKLQGELFVMLRKKQALARIAEENEASAIAVLEKAFPPREPYSPNTKNDVILAGFAGLLLAIVLAFAAELIGQMSIERRERQESQQTTGTIRNALGRSLSPSRGQS